MPLCRDRAHHHAAPIIGDAAAQPFVDDFSVILDRRAAAASARCAGENAINALGGTHGACSDASLAGFVHEEYVVASFNEARHHAGRTDLVAATTRSTGLPKAPEDILVHKGQARVASAQVKCRQPLRATAELSKPEYAGQQKIVPSEQVASVRKSASLKAAKLANSDPDRAARYRDTAKSVSDKLEVEGIESAPATKADMTELAKKARRGEAKLPKGPQPSAAPALSRAAGHAFLAGAASGGVMVGAVSGLRNYQSYRAGVIDAGDAIQRVGVDAGVAALDSGAKAVLSTMLKAGATTVAKTTASTALRSGAGAFLRGNLAVAVGVVTVDLAVGLVQVSRGNMDGAALGRKVGGSASSAAGGTVGALIGSIVPGFGTLIGGAIGSLIGGYAFDRLARA